MTNDPKNPMNAITELVEQAVADAYAKGWAAASEAILGAANSAKVALPQHQVPANSSRVLWSPEILLTPRRTGRPATNTSEIVEHCIESAPGMKGVKVVQAAQMVDNSINERTVRTSLRRLKASKKIWQRNGLWYPKAKQRTENENEEANSSPPH